MSGPNASPVEAECEPSRPTRPVQTMRDPAAQDLPLGAAVEPPSVLGPLLESLALGTGLDQLLVLQAAEQQMQPLAWRGLSAAAAAQLADVLAGTAAHVISVSTQVDAPAALRDVLAPAADSVFVTPLRTANGVQLGLLCAVTTGAAPLPGQQVALLQAQSGAMAGVLEALRSSAALEARCAALTEENWRLGSTLDGTQFGTWEWNVQTGETRFNEAWAEFIGYRLEELQPTSIDTWTQHTHPDDLARSGAALEAHFSGQAAYYECEARMQHRDGSWVWVLDRGRVRTWTADGQPEWMYGVHQLITERKQREQALRDSEGRLARVSEVAGIGGWELDCATGQLQWSDMTYRIHGLSIGDMPSLDRAIEFYAPEARPVIQEAVRKCLDNGTPYDLELPFIQADGTRIWVRAVGQAEREHDRTTRLTGAFQDITAQVELKQQLAAEQARLVEHTRALERHQRELELSNQSLENFAYVASHDLSSPLLNMRSFSELLIQELGPNLEGRREHYVKYLLQSMDRMQSRIEGLLSISRVRSAALHQQRTSLDRLLDDVCDDLATQLDAAQAEIERQALPTAYCDPGLMGQVLQNLIENSLRYRGEQPPVIRITGGQDDTTVWLTVADNGRGFEAKHAQRIFRLFERLERGTEGSGLGLAVSRLVLERHGGSITADAEPGRGATFTLRWPLQPVLQM